MPIVVAINKMDVAGRQPGPREEGPRRPRAGRPRSGAATPSWCPSPPRRSMGLDLLLENVVAPGRGAGAHGQPRPPGGGRHHRGASWRRAVARWPPCWCRRARCSMGDAIVTGTHYGRVRAMINSRGEPVKEVLPGYSRRGHRPVRRAHRGRHHQRGGGREGRQADRRAPRHEGAPGGAGQDQPASRWRRCFAKHEGRRGPKELRVVLKADVQGSLEAVAAGGRTSSPTQKVKVDIIHKGVGAMTETDVMLRGRLQGPGDGLQREAGVRRRGRGQGTGSHAADLQHHLRAHRRRADGHGGPAGAHPHRAQARPRRGPQHRSTCRSWAPSPARRCSTASSSAARSCGSCARTSRSSRARWRRLKRFKDDVKEVAQGFECGIGIENFNDLKPGDIIEAYEIEETRPSLTPERPSA